VKKPGQKTPEKQVAEKSQKTGKALKKAALDVKAMMLQWPRGHSTFETGFCKELMHIPRAMTFICESYATKK
jgi:hypothetical protein